MSAREIDKEKLEALRSQEAFDYYQHDNSPSWWESFTGAMDGWFKWVLNWIAEQFNWNIPILVFEILFYGIIIGGMLFLILKLMGVEISSVIPFRKTKIQAHHYTIENEDIDKLDFEKLLDDAAQSNNYMLMIRYRYLQLLKILADKSIIQYELRKTNNEYLIELQSHNVKVGFLTMAQIFERIWYGKIDADEATYAQMERSFREVKKIVS